MADVFMYDPYDTFQNWYYTRDYLMGRLSRKLTAGKRYCVSFHVSLADYMKYAIREIGAYFDNGAISATNFCGLPQSQYTPQVVNLGPVITDSVNWTKIEGSFVANGTEKYITIGNFKDRLSTTTIYIPSAFLGTAYYYVDDVSVVESGTPAYAGPDTHVGFGDSVFIGRKDVAMDCYWTKLGSTTVIGRGAGIWVKPAVTSSYVVTQTLCGTITKDTVKVEVWAAGVSSVRGQSQMYTIVPNPAHNIIAVRQSVPDDIEAVVEIITATGGLVYQEATPFISGQATLNIASLPGGCYLLRLYTKDGNRSTLYFVKD